MTTSLHDMSYTGIVPGGIPKSSLFSFGMIKVVSSEEVRIVEKKKDMSIVDSAGSSTKATRAAVIGKVGWCVL